MRAKLGVLILAALALSGCGDMNRAETIEAVKQCRDGGLSPAILINGWTGKPRAVTCVLPKTPGQS